MKIIHACAHSGKNFAEKLKKKKKISNSGCTEGSTQLLDGVRAPSSAHKQPLQHTSSSVQKVVMVTFLQTSCERHFSWNLPVMSAEEWHQPDAAPWRGTLSRKLYGVSSSSSINNRWERRSWELLADITSHSTYYTHSDVSSLMTCSVGGDAAHCICLVKSRGSDMRVFFFLEK